MVRLALEFAGFRVLDADSGEAGLELIDTEKPDVILLDLRLPGMDGWAVLDHLRQNGRLPSSNVIVISAHGSPGTTQRAAVEGCKGYLRKPFHPDDLVRAVERLGG